MIIRAAQLKAARRHAQRMGEQIGGTLDNDHDEANGQGTELLLAAWAVFIAQFGDDESSDTVARDYIADGFRIGVSGVNPKLTLVVAPDDALLS